MKRAVPDSSESRLPTLRHATGRLLGLLALGAAVGGTLLLAQGCRDALGRGEDATAGGRGLPVATARPEAASSFTRRRTYTGEVRARRTSDLGFERAGRVLTVDVDEGQRVEAGAVVATLERDRLQAQRQRLLASEREADAVLAEMRAGPRVETIAAAEEFVSELKAQTDLLSLMRARREKLLAERHISDEEYDEVASRFAASRARHRAAGDRLEELKEGTRPERIEAQEARIAALRADLALLDVDLADSALVAPFTGRVHRRLADEGAVVGAGTPVVTLVEDEVLEAWVGVPPTAALRLPAATPQTVSVGAASYAATLKARLPGTDRATRTQTVVFALPPEACDHAVPGQVARLVVDEVVEADGFWVPASALTRGVSGLWALFGVDREAEGGRPRVVRHHVEVLHALGDRVLVRGSLRAEDEIVVGNTERIAPGQTVAPVTGGV